MLHSRLLYTGCSDRNRDRRGREKKQITACDVANTGELEMTATAEEKQTGGVRLRQLTAGRS